MDGRTASLEGSKKGTGLDLDLSAPVSNGNVGIRLGSPPQAQC